MYLEQKIQKKFVTFHRNESVIIQSPNHALILKIKMAEEEGFEPPRAVKPLSVFKTDPFSRTWVFLRIDKNYLTIGIL